MIGTSTASGALSVVAWNGDGSVLAAAGQYKGGALRNQVRFWPMRGGKIDTTDVVASPDTITDLAFLPDGTLAYGTAEGSFGILGFDGRQRLARSADQCDFRDMSQDGFALSADGAVVDFVCRHGPRDRFRADLTKLVVTADPPPRGDLPPPSGPPAGLALGTWRNAATVTVAGRAVALAPHEHVRSAAGAPGRNAVVLGTDFYLRLEQSGGERWTSLLPGPAWGVAVTADGRSVVAALGDGTIRWYDLADGAETASLYLDARDRRWVVGVPEGFFEHSVGAVPGTSLVGFQFNNGPNKPPNFVSGARLYDAFHRPDLVQARVRGGPDRRLVDDALARLGDVAALAAGPSDGH